MALIGVSNTMRSFSVMRRRQAYLHIYDVLPTKAVRITVVSTSNDYLLKPVIFHL